MKYYKLFILLLTLPLCGSITAQTITGIVMSNDANGNMESLVGATVVWIGTGEGTVTDENGKFSLEPIEIADKRIRISFVGYRPDTVDAAKQTFFHIMLEPDNILRQVTVEGSQSATSMNTSVPVNVESLHQKELKKAACCNLSESFENNATVDVEFSDAVSGAKTVRLLGLDGVYSQVMTENMPSVRGLASGYGLSFIPGPWVDEIQVTKGSGSVINGYESITGAINTELKKPDAVEKEKFFFNVFGNSDGRIEANVNFAQKINEKLSTNVFLSTGQLHTKSDMNHDGFLDLPLMENYFLMNRWNYHSGKMYEGQAGIKYVHAGLTGGQTDFNPDAEISTENGYGVLVTINRVEAYTKNGLIFDRPNTSVGLIMNGVVHDQQSVYGLKTYSGNEKYYNANLIGQTYVFNTNHMLKAGMSFTADSYREMFDSVSYNRNELVPGLFAEYYFHQNETWSILGGIRSDFHNLYGTFISPRLHFKYAFSPHTTLRMSAGKGYRVANIFAENSAIFTSSRSLYVSENLLPEEAWNYGITFIQLFSVWNKEATLTIDAYRTDFVNQVVADIDSDVHGIIISNLHGQSYSNAAQAELQITPAKGFDVRIAYKYVDAKETYSDALLAVPFTEKNRGLLNLSYTTPKKGWSFEFTGHYHGSARLPSTSSNPDAYRFPDYSPDYFLLMAQVTKKFKNLEVYAGSENLTNYTQEDAIIAADAPFGEYFDASIVYAPISQRTFYAGLRFLLKKS